MVNESGRSILVFKATSVRPPSRYAPLSRLSRLSSTFTMLARHNASGGGRDSPATRKANRVKMLTPEENAELQVRVVCDSSPIWDK